MFTLRYNVSGQAKRYELPLGSTTVGRSSTCGVVVNDASVSRVHARFDVTRDSCIVTDAGSTNGTSINNEPITVRRLEDGDVVVIGRVPFHVEQSAADRLKSATRNQVVIRPHGA